MNSRTQRGISGIVAMAVVTMVSSCVRTTDVGDLRTESETVQLGGAESVRVSITMGGGTIELAGGAEELLDARFTYNVGEWKPEVNYDVSGTRGDLTVKQPLGVVDIPEGRARYEWDLRLNDDVPIDLSVTLGAGTYSLELSGLFLTGLSVTAGAGSGTIDMTGDWRADLDVSVKAGVGKITLIVPKAVGVRVDLVGGIGDVNARSLTRQGSAYVNDAYGDSAVTLDIGVIGGVGQINVELAD